MTARKMTGLAEAAVELRVPYPTAHRLLLTGVLAGEKRGGRWFVTRESVDAARRQAEEELRPRAAGV